MNFDNMPTHQYWKFYLKTRWRRLSNQAPYDIDDFVFKSDEDRARDIQEYYNPGKVSSPSELKSSAKSLIFYKSAEHILSYDCCKEHAPFSLQDENVNQWLEKLQNGEKISFNNAAQICQNAHLPHSLYSNLYATHSVFFNVRRLTFLDALPVWEAHLKKMHYPSTLPLKQRAQQIFTRMLLEEKKSGRKDGYTAKNYARAVFFAHYFNLVHHILNNCCCSDAPSTVLDLSSHDLGYDYASKEFENDILNNKIAKKIQKDPLLQTCKKDLEKLSLGATIPYRDAVEVIIKMWAPLNKYENTLPLDITKNRASIEQHLRDKDSFEEYLRQQNT